MVWVVGAVREPPLRVGWRRQFRLRRRGVGRTTSQSPPTTPRPDHDGRRRPSNDVHPNFYRLETAYSKLPTPNYNAALTPPLDIRNGFCHVPNAPGIGHGLNPEYVVAGPDKSLID